jgi:ABC-type nitrate/sulfonate/bicarbonate transport system ATPase subunit
MEYQENGTILCLTNVECGYGYGTDYKCILKDVNMLERDITRDGIVTGQTIAIVGRSGRGKSTLFKALTGLVKPRNGQVLLTDISTSDANDAKIVKEGDIGYVDQKYTLFRNKTVFDILLAAQRRTKRTKKEKEDIAEQYLHTWGLYAQKKQYPCELSGGQRQRTAIIEQILSAGHFMAFDEPFSGLDVGNIKSCKATFQLYQSEHELNTIIFSTHDMKLAVELSDSIYVIGHKEGYMDCSTIVHHYDLKALGLAWTEFGPAHLELLKNLTELVEKS